MKIFPAQARVVSYYIKSVPGTHFTFWEDGIGKNLPSLLGECKLHSITGEYHVADNNYDIAYCQPWGIPDRRPAKFVYSFLSDYPGHERQIAEWIDRVRPTLLCCLQQAPPELVSFGRKRGCRVELVPWFVTTSEPVIEKAIDIMCSGCVDPAAYPSRRRIFDYLSHSRFSGRAALSCSDSFGCYPMGNDEYRSTILKAKYYASGGIYDTWIPPKYYEALNSGACLLSFPMPHMEECGFVDGETFIQLRSLEDIDRAVDSERWRTIGPRGREMVGSRHTVKARAKRILEIYHEFAG